MIDGHQALKIEPGSSGRLVQYLVPDGKGNIFLIDVVVYDAGQFAVPAGASEQKVRAIAESFRFT